MMCYKDMTFCQFADCAYFDECPKAFTDLVKDAATEWWGSPDFPVSLYYDRPICFTPESDYL